MISNFPALLSQLHQLEFDYADGEGIDFEPFQNFISTTDTLEWLRLWTGNSEIDHSPFLVFGQDGTGGYAAFWLIEASLDILEQPIVFFGSEGEIGVVAKNFNDYLWLLAQNFGPYEAVEESHSNRSSNAVFLDFAKQHATSAYRPALEMIQAAQTAYPTFETQIEALCR